MHRIEAVKAAGATLMSAANIGPLSCRDSVFGRVCHDFYNLDPVNPEADCLRDFNKNAFHRTEYR